MNNQISNEIVINSTKNETIEIINASKKMIIITTKNSIRKLMIKKTQNLHRHQSRDFDDYKRYVSSNRVLNFEHDLFST